MLSSSVFRSAVAVAAFSFLPMAGADAKSAAAVTPAEAGIDAEVASFLASGVAFDPATALFVVWGGANDYSSTRHRP